MNLKKIMKSIKEAETKKTTQPSVSYSNKKGARTSFRVIYYVMYLWGKLNEIFPDHDIVLNNFTLNINLNINCDLFQLLNFFFHML